MKKSRKARRKMFRKLKMKFKDWLAYEFPMDELIKQACWFKAEDGRILYKDEVGVPELDAPVKHPIGVAVYVGMKTRIDHGILQEFNELLATTKSFGISLGLNTSMCYYNVRTYCSSGTKRRAPMIANIRKCEFITAEGRSTDKHPRNGDQSVPFDKYFKSLLNHKFSVSPEGNGVDCYRHYETILAKGIPIVQIPDDEYCNERWGTDCYMEKYDDLPVLWTKDYTELSVEYLEEKYEEFLETEFDFSRMTKSYWRKHSPNVEECSEFWINRHIDRGRINLDDV